MKKVLSILLVIMVTLSLVSCKPKEQGVVEDQYKYQGTASQGTMYGTLNGVVNEDSNTLCWLGVPYAKPPVGELRWKAPQSPDKWEEVLDAKEFKDVSIQLERGNIKGSEDCLYLNIWRPNTKEENLPVLIFAHGGGNRTGSGESFEGNILAEKTNSIIISINYRLGPMGWFNYSGIKTGNKADDSGNFGLLDIIQSLTWVKENSASFGGDSSNITLSGQSAGARDVLASLVSPLAKGLFQKAIAFSGGMTLADAEDGEKMAQDIVVQLVINDGKASNAEEANAWLKEQSTDELTSYLKGKEASEFLALYKDSPIKMEPFPHLFKDGYVIPEEGFGVFRTGDYTKVPVMLGSNETEFSVFAAFDPYFVESVMSGSIVKESEKLELYKNTVEYGSQIYAGFNVENVASLLVNNDDQPEVYGYRFAWGTMPGITKAPVNILFGANHGADMDFVIGHETSPLVSMFPGALYSEENKPGREELSSIMMSYIKNFLYTGNPNGENLPQWGKWTSAKDKDKILIFDADNEKAIVTMSKEYLNKDDIVAEMESKLSEEDRDIIINQLFEGRYFWNLWQD